MNLKPELEALLYGVDSPEARERIFKAYHSLSGADPEGFAVQFAILGAAIASRIERSVAEASKAVELASGLNYSPEAVAQKVLKEVPSFRDLKQLADSLKTAIKNSNARGRGCGSTVWCGWMLVGITLVNTALILCQMLRN